MLQDALHLSQMRRTLGPGLCNVKRLDRCSEEEVPFQMASATPTISNRLSIISVLAPAVSPLTPLSRFNIKRRSKNNAVQNINSKYSDVCKDVSNKQHAVKNAKLQKGV